MFLLCHLKGWIKLIRFLTLSGCYFVFQDSGHDPEIPGIMFPDLSNYCSAFNLMQLKRKCLLCIDNVFQNEIIYSKLKSWKGVLQQDVAILSKTANDEVYFKA